MEKACADCKRGMDIWSSFSSRRCGGRQREAWITCLRNMRSVILRMASVSSTLLICVPLTGCALNWTGSAPMPRTSTGGNCLASIMRLPWCAPISTKRKGSWHNFLCIKANKSLPPPLLHSFKSAGYIHGGFRAAFKPKESLLLLRENPDTILYPESRQRPGVVGLMFLITCGRSD